MEITMVAGVLVAALVLGLINLLSYVPMLVKLLLKRSQWMHREVTSDIPGNPHAFDDSVISLFRTLPELSNFNIVWTNLPLNEPLILQGSLPPARINSLSIYAPDAVPNSIDLSKAVLSQDGQLAIRIENAVSPTCSENFLSTNNWRKGFLVMRNYCVPPGTRVRTPQLVKAANGTVVRVTQTLTTGPPATGRGALMGTFRKLKRGMILNALYLVACKYFLGYSNSHCVAILLLALAFTKLLYSLLFILGGRSLKKLSSLFCTEPNRLYFASLEKGSEVSQPSTLHRYWLMHLDIPDGSDLFISGKILSSNQKYWSCTVYDEYGIPLPQYIFDENVNRISKDESGDKYSYNICITKSPLVVRENTITILDISQRPEMAKGYVLFRIVHPADPVERVLSYSSPKAELRSASNDDTTDAQKKVQ